MKLVSAQRSKSYRCFIAIRVIKFEKAKNKVQNSFESYQFDLTQRHIVDGFTDAEVTSWRGFPTKLAHLDELGRWRESFDKDDRIVHWWSTKRYRNLLKLAEAADIPIDKKIRSYPLKNFSTTRFPFAIVAHSSVMHGAYHRILGETEFVETVEVAGQGTQQFNVICPYKTDSMTAKVGAQALIVLDPRQEEPQEAWARYAVLPVKSISREAAPANYRTMVALHEMRQSMHVIAPYSSEERAWKAEYDADGFARYTLSKHLMSIGESPEQCLKDHLVWRWLDMLNGNAEYHIAPVLDAAEKRLQSPALADVKNSVGEIWRELRKINPYMDVFYFSDDDTSGYSWLRRIDEAGAFSGNPLTRNIVFNILESVEYLAQGVSRDKNVMNKIYPSSSLKFITPSP